VLGEIGAAATPQILVLNKTDRLPPGEHDSDLLGTAGLPFEALSQARIIGARLLADAGRSALTPSVMVSGLTGEGLARLFDVIDQVIPFDAVETVRFRIPLRDGAAIALLHERGKVRAEDYDGNLCEMEVDAPESLRRRLGRYLVRNSTRSVENSVNK
jgi:50S ribosomal subunit-associated GTPase HflX